MDDRDRKTIIIIGGGVAGLAAATVLADKGHTVTLLEQNSRLGGRTYSFADRKTDFVIDNGQHILMGCYTYTLRWLHFLGQTAKLKIEDRIEIPFREPGKKLYPLTFPKLVSPFHLIFGVLRFRSLILSDRLRLLYAGLRMRNSDAGVSGAVDAWLDSLHQSAGLKKYFWNPVCLAVMNENMKTASAKMFLKAIRQMFLLGRDFSKIIIPRVSLSELFVEPARSWIKNNGGNIRLHAEVEGLRIEKDVVTGVYLKNGECLEAGVYISAVTPGVLKHMLTENMFNEYFGSAARFTAGPIVSIYLWLNRDVDELFKEDFVGCIGTTIQWIFKKSNRCIGLTVSNAENMLGLSRTEMVRLAAQELGSLFQSFDKNSICHFQIIKELSATFSSVALRQAQPIANFFVIGDWTDTGLPSTIESAVKSAYLAVEKIESNQEYVIKEEMYA